MVEDVDVQSLIHFIHYSDVIMSAMASQITGVLVRGIHLRPVYSPHKGPLTLKMFPFDDVITSASSANTPFCKISLCPLLQVAIRIRNIFICDCAIVTVTIRIRNTIIRDCAIVTVTIRIRNTIIRDCAIVTVTIRNRNMIIYNSKWWQW